MGTLTACSSDSNFVNPGYDFRSVGKVAVLLTMNAGDAVQQQEVADMFAVYVLQKNYDVMDRANLADLSNEAALRDASGIAGPQGRAKLAGHGISAVIVVHVHMPTGEHWRARYGYADEDEMDITITARMLDVQTGALLWSGKATDAVPTGMAMSGSPLLGGGAGEAAGPVSAKTAGLVIGGSAGAPAGGAAGAALEPDMAQLLRSVIEDTCKELPPRTPADKLPGAK
jgi:hypothetical protein